MQGCLSCKPFMMVLPGCLRNVDCNCGSDLSVRSSCRGSLVHCWSKELAVVQVQHEGCMTDVSQGVVLVLLRGQHTMWHSCHAWRRDAAAFLQPFDKTSRECCRPAAAGLSRSGTQRA